MLRAEVGFGCPVKGCGNPYLEYHHFDPPVHVRPHNEPGGMIALCAQHHKKADGGAYTTEQLHGFKGDKANAAFVKGNLDWLRRDLLAVVGGVFCYETPRILVVDDVDVVSLIRDADGYLRLSVNMLSVLPEERVVIKDNSWENVGEPKDLRCPPQGKELEIKYGGGDYLYLRFIEVDSVDAAKKLYPNGPFLNRTDIKYPLTILQINIDIGGTTFTMRSEGSEIGGLSLGGGVISFCGVGFSWSGTGYVWKQNPLYKRLSVVDYVVGTNVVKVDFGKHRFLKGKGGA